ncbi:hypothetical protein [Aliiroseovarius sp.]|uniref:calcium-binding protein n=1 Tax=Aliiroseovarius sp. TaxID=1872442 RepID=UPI00261B760C|nr:hypothetical protein [Aliiroseovarius sp.]
MLYGLLLLGLLPLLFMTDLFGDDADDAGPDAGADTGADDAADPPPTEDTGNMLDLLEGAGGPGGPVAPVSEFPEGARQSDAPGDPDNTVLTPTDGQHEEPPAPGSPGDPPVDPDEVLTPTDPDEEEPDPADPVEPAMVLDPIDEPDEGLPVDGTLVEDAIQRDGDAVAGLDDFERLLDDTVDTEGTERDDLITAEDDGDPDTGEGELDLWDGTPLIETPGELNVVDGGAGDDQITTGDTAGYAFGGVGNDQITLGDGTTAAFGGAGVDILTGGGSDSYLDGGAGDDVIQGGDGDEILKGGVHVADSDESDDDVIDGGAGDDDISGGDGADTLSGGQGNDVIDHNGLAAEENGAERHAFDWHLDGDADLLDGGDGNDTLVMDRHDTATGGAGNDTFWLYADDEVAEYAAVTDFVPGEDFLRVELNPDTTNGDIILDVHPSEDGAHGEVWVNGQLVAMLEGMPDASASDVYVSVQENVFR